ncbi:MAG TPA: hypothetical protein VL993_04425 [Stellaceae bacterium]|nr:hypothetical protein [Stellaceae bacterium]
MTVTTAASNPATASAAVPVTVPAALIRPQASAQAQSGAGASAASSQAIIGMSSTTSAAGVITTVITYANGSTATMTSSGPMPSSTISVVV